MVLVRRPTPSSEVSPIFSGKRTPVRGSATSARAEGAARARTRTAVAVRFTGSPPATTFVGRARDVAQGAQPFLLLGAQAHGPPGSPAAAVRAPALEGAAPDGVRHRGSGDGAAPLGRIGGEIIPLLRARLPSVG